MFGGVVVVVEVAKGGEYFGECRLTEDSVMLLCQSAWGASVLRALPVFDWLKILQVTSSNVPGQADAALLRAERMENRVFQKGVVSPSPPRGKLTGNAGALAAWAAELAEEWADNGRLFHSVEQGGIGVRPETFSFRSSGYTSPTAAALRRPSTRRSWQSRARPSTRRAARLLKLRSGSSRLGS